MKTTYAYCTAALLLTIGCGRTPVEDTAGSNSGTDTDATAADTTATQPSTETDGSMSDSQNPTETGGGNSESQTDTGDTTATTSPITMSEPTSATASTGPPDPTVDDTSSSTDSASSSGDSLSVGDTSTGDSSSTSGDTSTSGDDTTTTGDDTTTDGTDTDSVQCGLQLQVTIRDFQFSHPDMEDYCCGQINGLVQPMLGNNNKPVFAMVGNPQMLTDAPTFAQWYTDVPGVNQKTTILIDLTEVMPGVFSYQNNSFFPVDNMLWGNEGEGHNFHFTTEIHTQFQYNGGETFQFSGDDDVWVFINKQLVIDIGGVHGQVAKMVALDSLGLNLGTIYPLDVFHAERHTVESNFRIDTTICSMPQ